jgi:hypothetical protein
MLGILFEAILHVVGMGVQVKNRLWITLGPIIDDNFQNFKEVCLPYIKEDSSGFRMFILSPSNTNLHYYFKYNSSYNYSDAIKFLKTNKISTSEGSFELIDIDEDLIVDMR